MAARQAEDVMLLLVDPAALGGLAGLIAVASWAMGRAHGPSTGEALPGRGAVGVDDGPVPDGAAPDSAEPALPVASDPSPMAAAPAPCQQRALEERRAAFARPFVLSELHAEASAIRRDERILGDGPCPDAPIVLTRAGAGGECRFIGLSGQPTCPGATRQACPDSGACQAAGVQPSPEASFFTRV